MSTEVFRFVTIRPPQQVDESDASYDAVDLGLATSLFLDELRKGAYQRTRSSILGLVSQFIASGEFIDSPRKLDNKVVAFMAALRRLPEEDFWVNAGEAFSALFDTAPAEFIKSEAFTTVYLKTTESVVAALISDSVSSKNRSLLIRLARALWLIRRLANSGPVSRTTFLTAPLILPHDIFPIPVENASLADKRKAAADANAVNIEARRKRMAQLLADLTASRQAAEELMDAFERAGVQQEPAAPAASGAPAVRPLSGFRLAEDAANALTDSTQAALKKIGIPVTQIDIPKGVTLLEKQSAALARQLYGGPAIKLGMIRIGNRIIPKEALMEGAALIPDLTPNAIGSPGPCPPAIGTEPTGQSPTVPVGSGEARILGIADLLVVEQDLLRYELGEIAHIENILKSEERSRKLTTTDTTQVTQTTETETTQDKEQDLASTDRFELQTESQTVINDNASKAAGLTIHASYGPSVDATANYNTSSSTSTQQSNTASSSYAREVTNKAVERVQTRTLTSRTVTTINVAKEVNKHGFDNKAGAADIVGIYRFVDKIYQAQVVSYGKRLMLEFIVPEPAAFLRYALTNKPLDTVSQINPDPPGYCLADGASFVPLQASDIARDNYVYWASKYGAQDVNPPPASVVLASGSKKAPDTLPTIPDGGDRKINSDLLDITIPDGYLAQSAFVNIYGETQSGTHRIFFQLQDQQGEYIEPVDDKNIGFVSLQPAPTLTVTLNSIGFHNYEVLVTVFCALSAEAFAAWQLKTFASVMNAYNDLKSAYDQAIKEAKLNADDGTVTGTNPENNRITEQTELKRGCISLLTGQRFDLFDALTRNVAPYGYPEIDFTEAEAEGPYIEMFEQSFEWNNMVYLFYPYFWGKKDGWVTIAQLTDDDPLFAQFLRAGAARVQVPVRLGFEDAILTYLSTGELWAGEGNLTNSDGDGADPLYLSIIDEIKSQTGDNNIDGVGTVSVTKDSVTVTGNRTEFTQDDENKRIVIAGVTYVIMTVTDAKTIGLATAYLGNNAQGLGYALGGKLTGQPWEIKVPTNLIKLDGSIVIH